MSSIQTFVNQIKKIFFFNSSGALIKRTVSAEVSNKGCIRKRNEDAVLSRSALGLWAVADGMGGHLAGDYASQEIVSILEKVRAEDLYQSGVSAIVTALEQAHENIKAYSREELEGRTVGSTVVVLLLEKENVHCLWIGDSRLYRYRDGVLEPLSHDHSQAFALMEQGQLSPEEVDKHPSSHVLTRAMGSGDFNLDYQCYPLKKGDKFLLCSDGLYGELSNKEIAKSIKTGTVQNNVQVLLQQTLDSGARDNVSIILVDTNGR
jgi:serine/threonine protein phosphatase PrpC